MMDWSFDAWPAVVPEWGGTQPTSHWDEREFHVDLGCGTVKKGRIGVDRYPAPGVNVVMDLDEGWVFAKATAPGHDALNHDMAGPWSDRKSLTRGRGLPFPDSSIESVISHHCLEHIGKGFIPLIDEVYRVLVPGGIFRPIVPLFPSYAAVSDPDHCRYFMEGTFVAFCGHLGSVDNPTGSWLDSFSVPYTKARFEMLDEDITPRVEPEKHWTRDDVREMRVALGAVK